MGLFSGLFGSSGKIKLIPECDGSYIPMEKIPDEVFSGGILGPCCAVEPTEKTICSPADGKLVQVADTLHAFCIDANGIEILVHLGIDTVSLKGKGFKLVSKVGAFVKAGQPVVDMDIDEIRNAGLSAMVITVVTNPDICIKIEFVGSRECLANIEKAK